MKIVKIKDIKEHIDEEIKLRGWVRNYRKASSKLRFVVFRDGSGVIQAVAFKPEMGEENFEKVKSLTIESSVELTGTAKKHPNKEDTYEFQLKDLKIISLSPEYPIGKKEHGPDFLLSKRHLWLRSPKQAAGLKIRHTIYYAICEYLNSNDFYIFYLNYLHTYSI